MNIQLERLPECKATLKVEIPAETVATERQIVTGTFASQAKIPGFRAGKTPLRVIEQRFAGKINDEVEERLINTALRKAIADESLDLLSVDAVTDQALAENGAFSCNIALTTNPSIELPDYSNIPVRLPRLEIGDEQVNQSLEKLRERYATFADIDNRKLQMGDFAVISYQGNIDGKPVDEVAENAPPSLVKAAGQWIRMDEEGFLPGFCSSLVDAEAGETREVSVVLDEEFSFEPLRNTEIIYTTEITAIKEQQLPELDDAFASKVDEGKTLEEIKQAILEELENDWQEQIHNQKINQVVAYLDAQTEFELPPGVVAGETQNRADEIAADAQSRGMPQEQILSLQDEIIETASRQARLNVKTGFLLDEIAKQENIEVTNEEVSRTIIAMAARQGKPPKKLIKELEKNQAIGRIRNNILTQKALAHLVENVTITEFDPEAEPDAQSNT
jgi:trigger factor